MSLPDKHDDAEQPTYPFKPAHVEPEPEVRQDLVSRVRRELDEGTYDEDAKIDALLDRLVADVLASGPDRVRRKRSA